MAKSGSVFGIALALLLSIGVIATILAVLMTSGGSDEVQTQTPSEEATVPKEGDFVYTEGKTKTILVSQTIVSSSVGLTLLENKFSNTTN